MIVLLVYEKIGVDYGRTDGHGNNKGYWLDFGTRNRVLVCIVNLYREVEVTMHVMRHLTHPVSM